MYAECLTGAQVTQLAKGTKPTGPPIPLTPASRRRPYDLARMGWAGESRAMLPSVSPDEPKTFTFARINRCVDAKRPVAYPYEGLLQTTWPSILYGPSTRGQRL